MPLADDLILIQLLLIEVFRLGNQGYQTLYESIGELIVESAYEPMP